MTSSPKPPSPTLPFPIVAPRRKAPSGYRSLKKSIGGSSAGSDFPLFRRSRTTNLAVLIISSIAAISILINIRQALGDEVFRRPNISDKVPLSIKSTLQSPHSNLKHLIMVPGHAIWTGCDGSRATEDDQWILEPMQRDGSVKTFIKHITKAAELAVQDPEALLMFSGGQTRPSADMTEGTSYARLAKAGNIYAQFASQDTTFAFDRVTTEDFALDSMENVLFSIARFKEFTGRYPTLITIVGFGMKRRRYEDVHRAALRWPVTAFRYIGIDNESSKGGDYLGERVGGLEPFVKDPYGCKGTLMAKRRKRNPFRRFHSYHTSAPELSRLLEYCPSNGEMFDGRLPWD